MHSNKSWNKCPIPNKTDNYFYDKKQSGVHLFSKLKFEETFDSLALLENALQKLRVPQEIETYNEVKKTLDYFQQKEPNPIERPRYTHKIPWKLITDLKDETRAVLNTSQGEITLKLMPVVAPGTVANFVELVNDGFHVWPIPTAQ